ncbi:unnamed protein product [Lepeophtheirus salmonis]|uniref:(salmon louse) hypothetical protein n=1 Tax=Lepeophtheirus salmonis TaxID=72036 RepID=A0A7R8CW17_LEPSM|nr:unnamed protein product [Lepeophtheirus salmonis]CAF2949618.1 unnamed protein product [Lepeophtheirus salmonis]
MLERGSRSNSRAKRPVMTNMLKEILKSLHATNNHLKSFITSQEEKNHQKDKENYLLKKINLDIMQYIKESCEVGDLLMGVVISWIQENGVQYFNKTDKLAIPDKTLKPSLQKPFSRLWIYSHHIYSKIKRKNILNLSKDYKVNGFSMPGKPGIICLEGQFVEDILDEGEIRETPSVRNELISDILGERKKGVYINEAGNNKKVSGADIQDDMDKENSNAEDSEAGEAIDGCNVVRRGQRLKDEWRKVLRKPNVPKKKTQN